MLCYLSSYDKRNFESVRAISNLYSYYKRIHPSSANQRRVIFFVCIISPRNLVSISLSNQHYGGPIRIIFFSGVSTKVESKRIRGEKYMINNKVQI